MNPLFKIFREKSGLLVLLAVLSSSCGKDSDPAPPVPGASSSSQLSERRVESGFLALVPYLNTEALLLGISGSSVTPANFVQPRLRQIQANCSVDIDSIDSELDDFLFGGGVYVSDRRSRGLCPALVSQRVSTQSRSWGLHAREKSTRMDLDYRSIDQRIRSFRYLSNLKLSGTGMLRLERPSTRDRLQWTRILEQYSGVAVFLSGESLPLQVRVEKTVESARRGVARRVRHNREVRIQFSDGFVFRFRQLSVFEGLRVMDEQIFLNDQPLSLSEFDRRFDRAMEILAR